MDKPVFNDENIAKYLSGDLDEIHIEQMERDLLSDKEKEEQMKDLTRIWEKSAELAQVDAMNVDADWDKVSSRMGFKHKTKKLSARKYFIRFAALFILAFGLAYFFNTTIKQTADITKTDYYQLVSENTVKEVVLPDNSTITLNKEAKVFYNTNFGITNRDVILEGEAFFQVERNEELPFKIFVGGSTVEVLGTSFNIKPKEEAVTVSVVSGKVAFYETSVKENRIELVKDEQAAFNEKNHSFKDKELVNQNIMAWRTGFIVFDGESLDRILPFLADYFGVRIIDETNELSARTLNSVFKSNQTISDILHKIIQGTGGEFTILEEQSNYIIRKKELD